MTVSADEYRKYRSCTSRITRFPHIGFLRTDVCIDNTFRNAIGHSSIRVFTVSPSTSRSSISCPVSLLPSRTSIRTTTDVRTYDYCTHVRKTRISVFVEPAAILSVSSHNVPEREKKCSLYNDTCRDSRASESTDSCLNTTNRPPDRPPYRLKSV